MSVLNLEQVFVSQPETLLSSSIRPTQPEECGLFYEVYSLAGCRSTVLMFPSERVQMTVDDVGSQSVLLGMWGMLWARVSSAPPPCIQTSAVRDGPHPCRLQSTCADRNTLTHAPFAGWWYLFLIKLFTRLRHCNHKHDEGKKKNPLKAFPQNTSEVKEAELKGVKSAKISSR